MGDFLMVLLVIFLIFSVFRRYIFFLIVNAFSKKIMRSMDQFQQQQAQNQPGKPEGQVTVEDQRSKPRQNPTVGGEYVDYEEVKD